jgi:hypothetical protein
VVVKYFGRAEDKKKYIPLKGGINFKNILYELLNLDTNVSQEKKSLPKCCIFSSVVSQENYRILVSL